MCAEIGVGRIVQRLFKPGRSVGRIPAGGMAARGKGDLGLVGRVVFQQGFELLHGHSGIDQRRQAQRELEGRIRPQHIAGVLHVREAIHAHHAQCRRPGAVEQALQRIGGGGQGKARVATAVVVRPGKVLVHGVAQDGGSGPGLR